MYMYMYISFSLLFVCKAKITDRVCLGVLESWKNTDERAKVSGITKFSSKTPTAG